MMSLKPEQTIAGIDQSSKDEPDAMSERRGIVDNIAALVERRVADRKLSTSDTTTELIKAIGRQIAMGKL